MKIIECEQGSQEWHCARAGAITASMFRVVRDRLKSGPNAGGFKKEATDYAFRLAFERITSTPMDQGFETWQMRRGHELEPMARAAHEQRIGMTVEQCGIVLTDDLKFGASADGLIGRDGGSEYKCLVSPEKVADLLLEQDFSDYMDQVQGCLWLTGRRWWHFCLYCPDLEPLDRELTIRTFERDDDYIEELEKDLLEFDQLVERKKLQLLEAAQFLDAQGKPVDQPYIPEAAPAAVNF